MVGVHSIRGGWMLMLVMGAMALSGCYMAHGTDCKVIDVGMADEEVRLLVKTSQRGSGPDTAGEMDYESDNCGWLVRVDSTRRGSLLERARVIGPLWEHEEPVSMASPEYRVEPRMGFLANGELICEIPKSGGWVIEKTRHEPLLLAEPSPSWGEWRGGGVAGSTARVTAGVTRVKNNGESYIYEVDGDTIGLADVDTGEMVYEVKVTPSEADWKQPYLVSLRGEKERGGRRMLLVFQQGGWVRHGKKQDATVDVFVWDIEKKTIKKHHVDLGELFELKDDEFRARVLTEVSGGPKR
jgi:hypothetical protein